LVEPAFFFFFLAASQEKDCLRWPLILNKFGIARRKEREQKFFFAVDFRLSKFA